MNLRFNHWIWASHQIWASETSPLKVMAQSLALRLSSHSSPPGFSDSVLLPALQLKRASKWYLNRSCLDTVLKRKDRNKSFLQRQSSLRSFVCVVPLPDKTCVSTLAWRISLPCHSRGFLVLQLIWSGRPLKERWKLFGRFSLKLRCLLLLRSAGPCALLYSFLLH